MKFRNLGIAVVASAALFSLAACGPTGKETYTNAYKNLQEAKTVDSHTDVSFDVKTKGKVDRMLTTAQTVANDLSISFDTLEDREAKKTEMNAEFKGKYEGKTLGVTIPMLVDEKSDKVYFKTETIDTLLNLTSQFGAADLPPNLPKEAKGKVVEADMETTPQSAKLAKELDGKIQKLMTQKLDGMKEESFVKDKDAGTVTTTFTGEETEALAFDLLTLVSNTDKDSLTKEDIKEAKKEFKKNASVGNLVITSVIKDDKFVSEKAVLPIKVKIDGKSSMTVKLHVDTKYNDINGKLNYTFKFNKKDVLSTDEFTEMFAKAMSVTTEEKTSNIETVQ